METKKELPLYLVFGARPVKFERTADGGLDVLAFDWETGEFVRDLSYPSRYFRYEPETEMVTKQEFDDRVEALIAFQIPDKRETL